MHKFLRSVGFSDIRKRDLEMIIKDIKFIDFTYGKAYSIIRKEQRTGSDAFRPPDYA